MMSLTFGLFTYMSDLGPHGPLVLKSHQAGQSYGLDTNILLPPIITGT